MSKTIPKSEWVPVLQEILEDEEHTIGDIVEFIGCTRGAIAIPTKEDKEKGISKVLFNGLLHYKAAAAASEEQPLLYAIEVPASDVPKLFKACEFIDIPDPFPIERPPQIFKFTYPDAGDE